MSRSMLWLHSARHRPAAAAGLFAIVLVAVASALTGPVLVRAAEQSALRSALERATPGQYDIVVTADIDSAGVVQTEETTEAVAGVAGTDLFRSPVTVYLSSDAHSWRARNGVTRSSLLANFRDDCDHVRVVTGRCALRGAEVVVPTGTAKLGDRLSFGNGTVVTVVGEYRPDRAVQALIGATSFPLLMPVSAFQTVTQAAKAVSRSALRAGRIDLDRLPAALRTFGGVQAAALDQTIVTAPETALTELSADIGAQRRVATVIGLLVVVPLVVLCWWALMLVMQLIAVVRGAEWALGRLRGLPVLTWLRSIYAEPLMLVALGTVAGLGVGYLVSSLTVAATTAGGIHPELWRLPVLFSVVATVLGATIGVGLATLRGIRVPLATLLQASAEPPRLGRAAVATQVLLVAITALALVQLVTQQQVQVGAGNLGLLLPGLLAALLTGAAVQIGAARIRRRTGRVPSRASGLLLGRRLARTPTLLTRHALTAVATALVIFSVSFLLIMNRNVELRAGNEVGAARVLHVEPVLTGRLIDAVRAADPTGRYAMAAAELDQSGSGATARVVAVDSSRLAAVSSWRPGWAGLDAARLPALLDPPHPASIVLRGTRLTVRIADAAFFTSIENPSPNAPPPNPELGAVLLVNHRWTSVGLGAMTRGSASFTTAISCPRGCVLRRLVFTNPGSTMFTGRLTVASISTDRQPASVFAPSLARPSSWQNDLHFAATGDPIAAKPERGSGGLHVAISDLLGKSAPAILPADGPAVLPAVIAEQVDVSAVVGLRGAVDGAALDQQPLPIRPVARAAALPRSVQDGVLVDLAAAQRLSDPATTKADDEVWLSADAPDTVVTALRRHGLIVTRVDLASAEQSRLLTQAPVRTLVANRTSVVLIAVLALVALGVGTAVDSVRRRRYVRVLRDAGFAPRAVARFAMLELLVPAAVAVLLGAVAGAVSLLLAGPRLPLFGDPVGPPIDAAPGWWSIGAVVLAALVVVAVAAATLGLVDARTARGRQ